MRRTLSAAAMFIVCIGAAALLLLQRGDETYRVAAIFDTARGIVPGNEVKITGVGVGEVKQVKLAPGPKARVVMDVRSRFGPFHQDATCKILPEGLISESYVQCDPGSRQSGPLAAAAESLPTVPVAHTSVPTSLQQVLDVFSLPTDDRIRVMLGELGIATSGRGADINAVLRRSNPALTQAQRVLGIIADHRQQLTTGIADMNRVLDSLSTQKGEVRRFVRQSSAVLQTTATGDLRLRASIRRLPGMLDSAKPALHDLDRTMEQGIPFLKGLHDAAPELDTATREFPAFAASATPALASVSPTAQTGIKAVAAAAPVVRLLKKAATAAVPLAADSNSLLINTREAGGLEGILSVLYAFATATAGYDDISHMIALLAVPLPQCLGRTNAPGCSAQYRAPGDGTIPPNSPGCGAQPGAIWDPPTTCRAVTLRRGHSTTSPKAKRPSTGTSPLKVKVPKPPTTKPTGSSQTSGGGALPDVLDKVGGVVNGVTNGVDQLLEFLLGP